MARTIKVEQSKSIKQFNFNSNSFDQNFKFKNLIGLKKLN